MDIDGVVGGIDGIVMGAGNGECVWATAEDGGCMINSTHGANSCIEMITPDFDPC